MKNSPLPHEIIELHAKLCSALSDPRRIMLLYAISEKPRNVTSLAEEVNISQPAASRHLSILDQQGLVNANREGPSVIYKITDERLIHALDLLLEVLYDRIAHRAELYQKQDTLIEQESR